MKLKSLILIAIFGTALSCSSNPYSIPIVDVNNIKNSIRLELSGLLNDIEVIELETTQYNLIGYRHHSLVFAYISNTSIVIHTERAIDQFDRQGRYIRRLTEKGNGPNEFRNVVFCFVDEETDILYYEDSRDRQKICRIDLSSGQFLEPLQTDLDTKRFDVWYYKNNHIYGFPTAKGGGFDATDPDSLVIASHFNLTAGSMNNLYGSHKYTIKPLGKSMVGYKNHISLFNMHYSDTIYQLHNNALEARFFVKMKNKMINHRRGGDELFLLFEYEKGIILLRNSIIYKRVSEGSEGITYYPEQYMLLNPIGGLKNIEQFFINPLDIAITPPTMSEKGSTIDNDVISYPFPKLSGSYGYYLIDQEQGNPHIILGKIK